MIHSPLTKLSVSDDSAAGSMLVKPACWHTEDTAIAMTLLQGAAGSVLSPSILSHCAWPESDTVVLAYGSPAQELINDDDGLPECIKTNDTTLGLQKNSEVPTHHKE